MVGGPLQGIRILDLTAVVVGPMATQTLADYGAEVIKVETPAGDIVRDLNGRSVTPGMSSKFLHLNRNKRSLVLDLKRPAGREALLKLAARSDVFLWNFRPSAMKRLKLAYEDLREVNPKIIYCGMFGFGRGGRYAEKAAYDTIIQGGSGVAALHQRVMGEPRYVPIVLADRTVGAIAVQMILLALVNRYRTGEGAAIDIPMFENMTKFVLEEHMYLKIFDPPLGPTGDPRVLDPGNRPVPTRDGWISITANTNAQAFALFDLIGRPELNTDPRFDSVAARFANVAGLYAIRNAGLKQKTTAEWLALFDEAGIPAMPCHTLDSLMEDPHLEDVGFFEKVQHPTEGTIINMALPNKATFGARAEVLPAPKIGQHSVEILREIGYDDAAIGAMISDGTTVDGRLPDKESVSRGAASPEALRSARATPELRDKA
jgi:crotonobetainyl-CoA:carnitine CoA-transferase CaiB-like acyl-CoA transferase